MNKQVKKLKQLAGEHGLEIIQYAGGHFQIKKMAADLFDMEEAL